jgi:hypothetical protein
MADRYWVGGAGTWDNASTTNWSATSGGASGASPPTAADNVIFNSASSSPSTAYAVTIGTSATALDITIAGPAVGDVTITLGATAVINCYGSWTNAATGVVFTTTAGSQINFLATTTGKTLTTNNVSFVNTQTAFNGAGGAWTLGSAFTSNTGNSLQVVQGTLNTNGFTCTLNNLVSTGSLTRSILLGASTLTCNGTTPINLTTPNLTFSGASSTINCSNAAPTFIGGGLTYGTVNLTNTSGGVVSFSGVNTFTTLNITSPTSNRKAIFIGNSMFVTGTLTLGAANAYNARIQVQSTNVGSAITLTVATITTLSDVDFRDITAAGASGTWSGTRLGNGLNNTNITFDAGKTVYWNLVAGGNWSANAWATSSGGAVATANFPLAQDTVIIDNTGLTASNTITIDASWWIGTLNVTRTNAWTFAFSGGPSIYGDVTLTSVTTVTGTAVPNFLGQGLTQTLTTNGVLLSMGFNLTSVGGTLLLNGNLTTASTQTITLNNGTLNLAGFTLSTGVFSSSNSNVRTVTSGAGSFTLTGNNATLWQTGTATNLTYTTIPIVNATYSGATGNRTFSNGGLTDRINLNITAGTDTISNSPTFVVNNYNFTGFAGTLANIATNIYGNLTLSTGMTVSAGGNAFTFSATSGTSTITSNGKTMDFPVTFVGVGGTFQLQDAMTVGATRTTTLTNGTLNLNNLTLTTGVFSSSNANTRTLAFGTGKIVLTGLNVPIWTSDTATNFSVTGTSRVEISGAGTFGQVRNIIAGITDGTEANSPNFYVTAGADDINFNAAGRKYGTIDFSNGGTSTFNGSFQSGNYVFTVYGNLILTSSISGFTTSSTFTGPITFGSTSGTKGVTTAAQTYPVPLAFNGVGGTWLCADSLTTSSTLTLTNGTLQGGGHFITCDAFVSTGAGVRSLDLSSGNMLLQGAGAVWTTSGTNFSVTPGTNESISLNSSGNQTFAGGGFTFGTLVIGGSGVKTITGNNTFFNIVNQYNPASVTFAAGSTNTFSNFNLNGISGSLVTLRSTVPGTQYTLVKV